MSVTTKGPWAYHAKLSGSENHSGYQVRSSAGWWVCDVTPYDEDGKEGEKLARLIAAAPELLEALEKVWQEGVIPDGFAMLQDQVCDAIAKATGEQP